MIADIRSGFDSRRIHHWIAFGFGAGLAPKVPGTFGTLVAVPLYWLLGPLPLVAYLLILVALFGLGIWACGRTARDLGGQDPESIVWDEVVGRRCTHLAGPVDRRLHAPYRLKAKAQGKGGHHLGSRSGRTN